MVSHMTPEGPKPCTAKNGKCPYGDREHGDPEVLQKEYDSDMMIQGNTKGMKKSLKDLHQFTGDDERVRTLSQKLLDCENANIRQMQQYL